MLVVIGVCLCVCAAVNVNRPTSFLDAAQQEKMREREALASGLMFSRDRLIEMIPVIYALNQHGSSTFTNHGQTGNGHLCQSLKCCPNISVCMAVLLVKVVVLINSYCNSVYVFSSDDVPFPQWQRPPQLEVSGELVQRGAESTEKNTQAEREGKVLAQLFLSKARYVCVTV